MNHNLFEKRSEPLISRKAFIKRLIKYLLIAVFIIFISLIIGILGYHFTEKMTWIDSLMNSSMILGGMGPVNTLSTNAGKIFASFYALYAGIVFLVVAGVLFAPVFHRLLHHFHFEMDEDKQEAND